MFDSIFVKRQTCSFIGRNDFLNANHKNVCLGRPVVENGKIVKISKTMENLKKYLIFNLKNIKCIEVHLKCIYTPPALLSCHQIFIIMVLKKVGKWISDDVYNKVYANVMLIQKRPLKILKPTFFNSKKAFFFKNWCDSEKKKLRNIAKNYIFMVSLILFWDPAQNTWSPLLFQFISPGEWLIESMN